MQLTRYFRASARARGDGATAVQERGVDPVAADAGPPPAPPAQPAPLARSVLAAHAATDQACICTPQLGESPDAPCSLIIRALACCAVCTLILRQESWRGHGPA